MHRAQIAHPRPRRWAPPSSPWPAPAMASGGGRGDGAVYTLTNSASGNAVAVFERGRDGSLTPRGTVADRRQRAPAPGSGRRARSSSTTTASSPSTRASNSISLLHVDRRGKVRLADVDPSGGARPISVTVHGKFVYVLNAGNATTPANIRGFLALWGKLVPLPGLDPAAEHRSARPRAGRVQPKRPPAGRDREGDEHDRHLQGRGAATRAARTRSPRRPDARLASASTGAAS